MRRHLTGSAAALAAALLLSSCGSTSAEPDPLPPAKASTTPSPSATPPTMPEAASEKTKAGAIAFTRHFIAALNHAAATGRTGHLRELYIAHCTKCDAIAGGIDETYAAGGDLRGGAWKPDRFKFYVIENDVAVLDAWVSFDRQEWRKTADAKPDVFPANTGLLKAFNLRWGAGQWKVSALDPNQ